MLAFEFIHVCTYTSYFQIVHSPAQAHGGTLWGLLCDQFSSQPHHLFPIFTEWEFLKQLVRLHSLNLCFWNTLFVGDDDLVFYDRDQFKRVFQSLLITPFSKDKKWMRPRQVQRNLFPSPSSPPSPPLPSFQPKYFVLCTYISIHTSIHIYVFSSCDQLPIPSVSLREDINEKKTFSFGHCPNEGGSTHARIFWPFFKKCIFGQ